MKVLNNKGGMGLVYLALDERLNSRVVVKESKLAQHEPELREKLLRSFKREAQLLAEVKYLGLVRTSDLFTENEQHYLVMDYVEGDDLDDLLQQQLARMGQPFLLADVLLWADRLLGVLQHLHQAPEPIIHNDIKPANLKLTPRGEIFLLDFGLAQSYTSGTQASTIIGFTREYASYEQIQGGKTDARSDLFSLAATLYHLVTGQAPVDAPTRMKVLADGQPDPLRPAHLVHSQVTLPVSRVLYMALSLSSDRRPPTAGALRQALWECRQTVTGSEPLPRRAEASTIVRLPSSTGVNQPRQSEENVRPLLYASALQLVLEAGSGSVAALQQQLLLNFEQARTLLERLRRDGILNPATDTVQLTAQRRAELLAWAIRQQAPQVGSQPDLLRKSAIRPMSSRMPHSRVEIPLLTTHPPATLPSNLRRWDEKLLQNVDWLAAQLWQGVSWLKRRLWQQLKVGWLALRVWYGRQGELHIPKEVYGLILLFIGFVVMLALLSYDPADLKTELTGKPGTFHNGTGVFGAHLAYWLYQLLGWLAYLFPLALLLVSWFLWRPWKVVSPLASLFGWSLALFGLLGLLALPDLTGPTETEIFRAGVIGRMQFIGLLVHPLGELGTIAVFVCCLLVGVGIAKPNSFRRCLHLTLSLLAKVIISFWHALTDYLENSLLKHYPQARRTLRPQRNAANSGNLSATSRAESAIDEDPWLDVKLDETHR